VESSCHRENLGWEGDKSENLVSMGEGSQKLDAEVVGEGGECRIPFLDLGKKRCF